MSMEQKGKFITLLCIQHQKGHMIEKDMLQICGTYDEDIFSKFKKDNDGKFYNERLKEEVQKRKAYSESRRNNRKKKEDMIDTSKTYDEHMENENENENKDLNKSKKVASFQKPTLEQVEEYMKERGMSNYASRFHNFYESKGWMVGKNKMKDWKAAVRNWEDDKKTAPKTEAPVLKVINLSDYE
jgi:hypothetical protein